MTNRHGRREGARPDSQAASLSACGLVMGWAGQWQLAQLSVRARGQLNDWMLTWKVERGICHWTTTFLTQLRSFPHVTETRSLSAPAT
jgi:hypothetical protein